MTLEGIKKKLLTLCTVQAVNLHGGRFAKCVEECVKELFKRKKRLDVVKFDRSIWSYYFHGRTDWELRGVARALRSLGVYTVTLIDGFGQTIVKVRHTGKFVRFRVNPLCICCAWLGRNHAAVRALGLYVPDFLYDLAASVRKDAALVASQSKPQEADYKAYEAAGFCVVREGDVGALLDAVQRKVGSGTVVAGVGDADAVSNMLELLLPGLNMADLTNDGDAALVDPIMTHERTLDRLAVYDARFKDDQRRKTLWTALNLLGKGDCMVRDVLSRTNQRDSDRFSAISGRIDSGHITTLDQLFAEAGASRDQRLHVIYALTTYVDGVWCVDGAPKPLRILATAEQYASSSLTRERVATRRAVLASSADSKLVEAVFDDVYGTALGYYGVKQVAEALMKMSVEATGVLPVLERRDVLLGYVDELFDDVGAVLATSVLAQNYGETELRGRLVLAFGDMEAWLALRNDDVFSPPPGEELDSRRAEIAYAALKNKVEEVESRLGLLHCMMLHAEEAVSRAGEASRRAVDALYELAAGSSVLDAVIAAATRHVESIDAAVVACAAPAFSLAVGAWARNDVEVATAQIDAVKAAVDAACEDALSLDARLACVAAVATRPGAAREAVRRHTDALRVALRDHDSADAVLVSVDARCGTATDAAADELRGALVAALNTLARGADVESQLAAADEACRGALAPVDLLARVASAFERARAAPGARTALPAALSDRRTALTAASDAARTTVTMHAPAALRAIAANDAAAAETELAAMETAVDSVLSAAAALAKAVADATRNSPEATTTQLRSAATSAQLARQRAERAAQSGGAGEPVDPVARWRKAVARTDSPAGLSKNQCEMVDREASMLTPPENAGEAPAFGLCRNFDRTPDGSNTVDHNHGQKAGKYCSMCGSPKKGTLTSQNVDGVPIANQVKDVCGHCIGAVWRHVATGYYLRFCKGGCKKFRHVHGFAQGDGENVTKDFEPFTNTRCFECRAKRAKPAATRGNKKPRLKK